MIKKSFARDWLVRPIGCTALMMGLSFGQVVSAATISLTVEQAGTDNGELSGNPTVTDVTGFRYLVEEDTTFKPTPKVPAALLDSLSYEFHKSHHPVASADGLSATHTPGQGISGTSATNTVDIDVPDNGRYFVSIVPFNDGAVGGGSVEVTTGTVNKTVRINAFPIPTAQISVRVFEDNNPVNGAIDNGELFLSHSYVKGQKVPFSIKLFDPAGQYGVAGGRVAFDAYGNPLGTQYDAAGNVTSMPTDDGVNGFELMPNENGYLVIKHLPPAKYGVEVTPPPGPNGEPMWAQTSTIEGTRTVDAWVIANEPEQFVEFGPPGPHIFIGFVRTFDCMSGDSGEDLIYDVTDATGTVTQITSDSCAGEPPVTGGATIEGSVVSNHLSRPTAVDFFSGATIGNCRVSLNHGNAGRTIYSDKCDEGSFSIDNIAPGPYTLAIWDDGLDVILAYLPFDVAANATTGGFDITSQFNPTQEQTALATISCGGTSGSTTCNFGEVPVFEWFHKLDTIVFFDQNQNGFRDCPSADAVGGPQEGEEGYCTDTEIDDVTLHADSSATNIRFRDGRIFKSVPIDVEGAAPHEEVFPFFHWQVAEVDFATFKATGATFITDAGGDGAGLQDNGYVPQLQTAASCVDVDNCSVAADGSSRTEAGAVLTAAFQGFLGQKNVMEFGKANYGPGENGGISGMAIYAITRAEDDPRFAAAEEWEPGIPRVQVALFEDLIDNATGLSAGTGDTIIDDVNNSGATELPDVDNHPLGWADGGTMGTEDIDRNGNGSFDMGDAIEVTWTDSWDDNTPTNCGGVNNLAGLADDKCFDGLRNWNQIRPGVFDGGYAFSENLPSGYYIAKSFTPPGYLPLTEDAKNVDFGDEFAVPQLLPPVCVGDDYPVPALLAHVTDDDGVTQVVNGDPADYESPYAGDIRPLCDTKHIRVSDGRNAAADFHYFTQVPKAANVVGAVINDLGNQFNPNSTNFTEKFGMPWVPVAFYDFKGHEITRVYTDENGKFNAMVPSTNTVNIASPSGVAPAMLTACMNDRGLVDDPLNPGNLVVDPYHNTQFSQSCYNFQYMPGASTYLDTPVVSAAAFAGAGNQLDCDAASTTPLIHSVTSSSSLAGAYISDTDASRTLTVVSVGDRGVPDPAKQETEIDNLVVRDYGFGTGGSVVLVDENGIDHLTDIVGTWANASVTVEVPALVPDGQYQLVVTNDDSNLSSPMGVTVTIGKLFVAGNGVERGVVREVFPSTDPAATPIQDAIDASADSGFWGQRDLILVAPGAYDEMPVMYQPVALQGAGAYSTVINARTSPGQVLLDWQARIEGYYADGKFDLLTGQDANQLFATEQGPGITVAGKQNGNTRFVNGRPSRIDGFTITGATLGGGILVSGNVTGLDVSNNLVAGNQGIFGGGVRLGHEQLQQAGGGVLGQPEANINNVNIHNNMITRNATRNGAGGGISIYNDSRNYRVEENLICGNLAQTDGGGIGHLGLSGGGQINDNTIVFNQSFRQQPGETDGGGIFIGGVLPENEDTRLSSGSGTVQINRNLIQGNQAGAGDGAGIALRRINGQDIADAPGILGLTAPGNDNWHVVNIRNNTIVNNVAGLGGAGISLLDSLRVNILNNTIANNESTATAGAAFLPGSPGTSSPQVAGILARPNDSLTDGLIDPFNTLTAGQLARYGQGFSRPSIRNNIIRDNRSWIYDLALPGQLSDPAGCTPPCYQDLSLNLIVATPSRSLVSYNLLTDTTGTLANNITGDPAFISAYTNGDPGINPAGEFNSIAVAPAADEGGNWLDVRYGPLSINDTDVLTVGDQPSDYHIVGASDAVDNGLIINSVTDDIDGNVRPQGAGQDIGSDEVLQQ